MAKPKMTAADKRRKELRIELFGEESWDRAWKSADEKRGYACVPRVLPILMELAHDKQVTGNHDCRGAYLELYCRNWGQAIVEITDEEAHALRAGYYTAKRSLRSWQERMKILEEQGFVEVRERSVRGIGYVMLRHPDLVICELRQQRKVEDRLWLAYQETCREFGLAAPQDPLTAGPQRLVSGAPAAMAAGSEDDDDIPF